MAMGSDVFRAGLRLEKTRGYDRAVARAAAEDAKARKQSLDNAPVGFRGKTTEQWIRVALREGALTPAAISKHLYASHSVWITPATVAEHLQQGGDAA